MTGFAATMADPSSTIRRWTTGKGWGSMGKWQAWCHVLRRSWYLLLVHTPPANHQSLTISQPRDCSLAPDTIRLELFASFPDRPGCVPYMSGSSHHSGDCRTDPTATPGASWLCLRGLDVMMLVEAHAKVALTRAFPTIAAGCR